MAARPSVSAAPLSEGLCRAPCGRTAGCVQQDSRERSGLLKSVAYGLGITGLSPVKGTEPWCCPPHRSLDAMVDGDEAVARAWLQNENAALGSRPVALIQSVSGLVHAVAYLDARRALA